MNLPTLLIAAVIVALVGLALWRLRKKGGCGCNASGGCGGCPGCAAHQTGKGHPPAP